MTGLLITRPREDAESLAAAVREIGYTPFVEPLLAVRWHDAAVPDLAGFQAVLFTSANGVRALARLTAARGIPALCVGDATAAAAAAAGFAAVRSAGGAVEDLARLAAAACRPDGMPLLHVAGAVTAGDLGGLLSARGLTVRRLPLYETVPADHLSPETVAALGDGRITAAALFSPRTARTLAKLVCAGDLAPACRSVHLFCLSAAVAQAATTNPSPLGPSGPSPLGWRAVTVAAVPTLPALLDALGAGLRCRTGPPNA